MANYVVTSCWTVNGVQTQKLLSQQPLKCWGIVVVKESPSRGNHFIAMQIFSNSSGGGAMMTFNLAITRTIPENENEPS